MSDKFYNLYLDKKVDKKDELKVKSYRFIQPFFKRWNSECLYLKPFSGIITCKDAFYTNNLYNLPIIVRNNEEGYFDIITGKKLEVIEPIKLYNSEVSIQLVSEAIRGLYSDHISKINYEDAIEEYIKIIDAYKKYLNELAAENPVIYNDLHTEEINPYDHISSRQRSK